MAAPLAYFLTFAYTTSGLGKLVPQHPIYGEMVLNAPLWLEVMELQQYMDAEQLRIAIGTAELVLGLTLPFFSPSVFGLIIIMSGALFTHFRLDGNKFTLDAAPAAFLLFCLIVLAWLNSRKKTPPPPPQPRKDD